jgi:hypothetical protein
VDDPEESRPSLGRGADPFGDPVGLPQQRHALLQQDAARIGQRDA